MHGLLALWQVVFSNTAANHQNHRMISRQQLELEEEIALEQGMIVVGNQ